MPRTVNSLFLFRSRNLLEQLYGKRILSVDGADQIDVFHQALALAEAAYKSLPTAAPSVGDRTATVSNKLAG